jgi:hypothetical protein
VWPGSRPHVAQQREHARASAANSRGCTASQNERPLNTTSFNDVFVSIPGGGGRRCASGARGEPAFGKGFELIARQRRQPGKQLCVAGCKAGAVAPWPTCGRKNWCSSPAGPAGVLRRPCSACPRSKRWCVTPKTSICYCSSMYAPCKSRFTRRSRMARSRHWRRTRVCQPSSRARK